MTSWNLAPGHRLALVVGTKDELFLDQNQPDTVVKIMSGGGDASVVSAMVDDISTLLFPHAAASAVILLIVLSVVIAGIMRLVDVRRELVGDR